MRGATYYFYFVPPAGDTAMEDALVLARTSSQVTLVHRRDTFRASKILAERVKFHERINVLWNTTVQAFHGETVVDADTGDEKKQLTHVELKTIGDDDTTTLCVASRRVGSGCMASHGMAWRGREDQGMLLGATWKRNAHICLPR